MAGYHKRLTSAHINAMIAAETVNGLLTASAVNALVSGSRVNGLLTGAAVNALVSESRVNSLVTGSRVNGLLTGAAVNALVSESRVNALLTDTAVNALVSESRVNELVDLSGTFNATRKTPVWSGVATTVSMENMPHGFYQVKSAAGNNGEDYGQFYYQGGSGIQHAAYYSDGWFIEILGWQMKAKTAAGSVAQIYEIMRIG